MTGVQQAEKQVLFIFSLQCTVHNFWGLFHCQRNVLKRSWQHCSLFYSVKHIWVSK